MKKNVRQRALLNGVPVGFSMDSFAAICRIAFAAVNVSFDRIGFHGERFFWQRVGGTRCRRTVPPSGMVGRLRESRLVLYRLAGVAGSRHGTDLGGWRRGGR